MDTNPYPSPPTKGGGTNLSLCMVTHGGVTVTPLTPLHTPKTPLFLHPYIYSTIFSKDQCFINLTISLGPDEVVTV